MEKWCQDIYSNNPKLCHNCIDKVLICNECDKIFEKNTIQFIDYNNEKDNRCVCCEVQEYYYFHSEMASRVSAKYTKSAFICWRVKYIDGFIKGVEDVYNRFNPMGIDYNLIFEVIVTLQWESRNREIYIDSLISFLSMESDERFANRLSRINKGMNVAYFNESQYDSAEYDRINLLGVFVRCAMLPKDMFMMILGML